MDACVDKHLVVSELLCYLRCKHGKLSQTSLKGVIFDFYSASDISTAKEILVDIVDKLNIDKWPKPARRKCSDNKSRVELEDIVNVFSYLDENMLLDKLPALVAANVDNLPSSRIEEGDLRCILNKLNDMDKKLDNVDMSAVESFRVELASLKNGDFVQLRSNLDNVQTALTNNIQVLTSHSDMLNKKNTSVHHLVPPPPPAVTNRPAGSSLWSDIVRTPRPSSKNLSNDETEIDSDCGAANNVRDADNSYTVVVNDRSKRRRTASSATKTEPIKTKPKTVIGSNNNCSLKAAKELKKKKVFCVSNLAQDTSCDLLKSWIESCDIPVITINPAKTKFKDSASFCVCVAEADAIKFISDNTWGSDVIVREWVFKPKNTVTLNN